MNYYRGFTFCDGKIFLVTLQVSLDFTSTFSFKFGFIVNNVKLAQLEMEYKLDSDSEGIKMKLR